MCPAPALGRPMGPALSGRVAASDEQIREPEQQRDALRVLRQSLVSAEPFLWSSEDPKLLTAQQREKGS